MIHLLAVYLSVLPVKYAPKSKAYLNVTKNLSPLNNVKSGYLFYFSPTSSMLENKI